MRKRAIAYGAALLLVSVPAMAQDEGWFDIWDEDESGFVTEEEFATGADEAGLFDDWDQNDDNLLGEEEFDTGLFTLWDDDGNRQLSTAEWDEGIDRRAGEQAVDLEFSAWDGDGSGALSREEFTGQIGQVGLFQDWQGGESATAETEPTADLAEAETEIEQNVDTDALISQDEFMLGLFDWVDEDDDNQVAPEEFGLLNDVFPE